MRTQRFLSFMFFAIFITLPYAQLQGNTELTQQNQDASRAPKDWNFMVYIAANNNLYPFGGHNLRQMARVGSTNSINILAQVDLPGQFAVNRYCVTKNNLTPVETESGTIEGISGTRQSLYDFVRWSVENFSAKKNCLVLWNHGSGIKDPSIWGRKLLLNRDKLFTFNPKTGLLELNRNALSKNIKQIYNENRMSEFTKKLFKQRGIAFNDTAEEYLTNQDLTETLSKISQNLLGGEKFDLICMDACHMGMIEIGSQIKDYAHYMVGSEEVEPGSGYNYIYLLSPFLQTTLSAEQFACHAVNAYEKEYVYDNADYTQSAINLQDYNDLEQSVKTMTQYLTTLISGERGSDFRQMIRSIRTNKNYTTEFCDTDYIDFCHFYKSLTEAINTVRQQESFSSQTIQLLEAIQLLARQTINTIPNYIIENSSGVNLPNAYGLAIYFPRKTLHKSYSKTLFDKATGWSKFVKKYLRGNREHKKNKNKK